MPHLSLPITLGCSSSPWPLVSVVSASPSYLTLSLFPINFRIQRRDGHHFDLFVSLQRPLQILISCSVAGFPGGSEVKVSAWNAGDPGLIPGLGRSPGEGNDNPLQYSCLENPMEGGAWWATVHGVTRSWTQLRLTLSLSETNTVL